MTVLEHFGHPGPNSLSQTLTDRWGVVLLPVVCLPTHRGSAHTGEEMPGLSSPLPPGVRQQQGQVRTENKEHSAAYNLEKASG